MMFGLTGIYKYLAIGIVALGLIVAIIGGVVSCKKTDATAHNQVVQAGADHELARQQGEVLNHVEIATTATRSPSVEQLNVVCSKYDRNCSGKVSK